MDSLERGSRIEDRGSLALDPRSSILDPRTTRRQSAAGGRRPWLRWLLIGIVVAYVALIILAPLGALLAGAFAGGVDGIVAALGEPDVLSAFWRTLLIGIVVVLVHAMCGTAVAW